MDKKRYLRVRLLQRVKAMAVGRDRDYTEENMDAVLLGLDELMRNDDVLRFLREVQGRCRRDTHIVQSMEREGLFGFGARAPDKRLWGSEERAAPAPAGDELAAPRSPRRPHCPPQRNRSPRPASVIETMRNNFNQGQEGGAASATGAGLTLPAAQQEPPPPPPPQQQQAELPPVEYYDYPPPPPPPGAGDEFLCGPPPPADSAPLPPVRTLLGEQASSSGEIRRAVV